ncbi:hypothetical protein D1872_308760 [compost metagenome]
MDQPGDDGHQSRDAEDISPALGRVSNLPEVELLPKIRDRFGDSNRCNPGDQGVKDPQNLLGRLQE